MYQNYPNYYVQPTPRPQIQLKGRPVSSLDEVRGTTIDFDGSIFFFPDVANKRIYTKQINMDGTAALNVYELNNNALNVVQSNNSNFVTREEFETSMTQINQILTQMTAPKKDKNAEIASQF